MKTITQETPCQICGKIITNGKMAQSLDGYVCEDCIDYMARHELVEIDIHKADK